MRPYAGETVAHVGGQAGPNGRLVVDEFGMNLNLANIPGTGNWTPVLGVPGYFYFFLVKPSSYSRTTYTDGRGDDGENTKAEARG